MRCFYAVNCPELVSKFAKKNKQVWCCILFFYRCRNEETGKSHKEKTYEVLTPRKFYTLKMRTILSI